MLSVLSPAKSLDYETPLATKKSSQPELLDQASDLVDIMAAKKPDEIGKLMSISDKLAELNFERFQNWETPFTSENARAALLAFSGDVYTGMDAPNTFSERDFTRAQKSLRILSGLYGLLKPLDLIQPYRLEMGTKLTNPAGRDLYAYWGSVITEHLNEAIANSPGANVLVNLASNEYFGAVAAADVEGTVISPVFLDAKADGDYKIVSFFAKKARGSMAGWLIQERVDTIRALPEFDRMGYRYDADRSTATEPVFTRRAA